MNPIILKEVRELSKERGESVEAILGRKRTRHLAHTRHLLYVRLVELGFSPSEVGVELGRDSGTIRHGVRLLKKKPMNNDQL